MIPEEILRQSFSHYEPFSVVQLDDETTLQPR